MDTCHEQGKIAIYSSLLTMFDAFNNIHAL